MSNPPTPFWQLPKHTRHSLRWRIAQLNKNIKTNADQLVRLDAWANNLRRQNAEWQATLDTLKIHDE